eukprot:TRINITY_DN9821_c0_g2_i1.p1 TRINITY_DN9821_c0_g2~~TRINITY_DN9821_c0_g2_i1.p1  ORF type:complete len:706 (+),score=81.24 TRINITY_DN9821_c0_g2_i1:55-2172(+)
MARLLPLLLPWMVYGSSNPGGVAGCECLQPWEASPLEKHETLQVEYVGEVRNLSVASHLGSCQRWAGNYDMCLREPDSRVCSRSWCIVKPTCNPRHRFLENEGQIKKSAVSSAGNVWTYSFATCFDNAEAYCWKPRQGHKLGQWCTWDATLAAAFYIVLLPLPAILLILIRIRRLCVSLFHGKASTKMFLECSELLWSWLSSGRSGKETDPIDEEARLLAKEWRLELSHKFLDYVAVVASPCFILVTAYMIIYEDWLQADPYLRHVHAGASAVRVILSMPLFELSFLCSAAFVRDVAPQLCTAKFFDACTVVLGLAGTVRPAFYVLKTDWHYHGQLLWLLRLASGICFSETWLLMVLGSASVLATVLQKWLYDFPTTGMAPVAFREVVFCILMLVSTRVWHWSNEKCAKFAVQCKLSTHQAETITTLLDRMTDAVVHLDNNHNLTTPAPKLEALLQASSNSLQKRCFYDLLPESEVERFQRALSESSQFGAGCLHTTMTDSNGLLLRVQIFYAPMLVAGGETMHICGIRDYSDEVVSRIVPPYRQEPTMNTDSLSAVPETSSSMPMSDTSSSSGWSSRSRFDQDLIIHDKGLYALVDLSASAGSKVVSCSKSFTEIFGIDPRKKRVSLASCMTVQSREQFQLWAPFLQTRLSTEPRELCFVRAEREGTPMKFLVKAMSKSRGPLPCLKESYVLLHFRDASSLSSL